MKKLLEADEAAFGEEGGAGKEAFYLDYEALAFGSFYLLIVALDAGEEAVLNADSGVGTEIELLHVLGTEELEGFLVHMLVETPEILHLLVGHDDGDIAASYQGLYLELEHRVVLLLQFAHLAKRGIDEEEIANHRTLGNLACAILLSCHALKTLHGQEGLYIGFVGFQCLDRLHFPAIGRTHRIPLFLGKVYHSFVNYYEYVN